jgi:hypothetical protein
VVKTLSRREESEHRRSEREERNFMLRMRMRICLCRWMDFGVELRFADDANEIRLFG